MLVNPAHGVLSKNQPSHIPSLRACKRCLHAGDQCIHCIVFIRTTDCEEGNKKAMELIAKLQEDQLIDPTLQYLVFCPDGVHVGNSSKCNSAIGLYCDKRSAKLPSSYSDPQR